MTATELQKELCGKVLQMRTYINGRFMQDAWLAVKKITDCTGSYQINDLTYLPVTVAEELHRGKSSAAWLMSGKTDWMCTVFEMIEKTEE